MANKSVRPPLPKSQSRKEDESIYSFADAGLRPSVLPRIKTYDFPAAGPTPTGIAEAAPLPSMRSKIQHADSTQMDGVLNPASGSGRGLPPSRAAIKQLNPSRNNVAAVREASQLNQLRRLSSMERERAQPQGFKALPAPGSTAASRSTSAPRLGSANNNKDQGRNFIEQNKIGAVASRQRTPTRPDDAIHKEFGRVPQYLLERKVDLMEAEEQRAAAKEASMIPPGMRLLGEPERQETLAILARNMDEVMKGIRALPFVTETPGQIRRKDDLERRLKEIEEAQKIFSRPKVFVHA